VAHIEPEALSEPERVYVAATLREALRVEEVLTASGVDYIVQVEEFATSLLFSARHGAVFYVATGQAAYCRHRLTAEGLARGVVDDEE
jgi:hypothetical protein